MSAPGFVAIDLGATSGRVMLGVLDDGRVELVECGRFPNGPVDSGDGLRWDVEALWAGILDGLRSAGALAERTGVEVRGIGVDSWAIDHGLLGPDGGLVGDPWCYRDARTAGVADRVYERVSFAGHYAVNGLQHLPFTTEFQLVAGADGGPGSAEWARASRLLLVPDLITYRLTGRQVAEVTNASTTGLLDARTRTWASGLLDRLVTEYPGLSGLGDRLPELVEPGTVVGPLTDAVREVTGLGLVPVFAVASHDTASAVVGTPLPEDGAAAYISSGTWSLVGVELPAPVLTDASREANFTNELGVDGTVRYLRNVMGLWILDECVREWTADASRGEGPPVDLGALLTEAAAEPGGRCLLVVDGDEFLAPGDMPARVHAAVRRSGTEVPETRAALARVVLDSLADTYARVVRQAGELAGTEIRAVHVVGGGSRNELLNRLTAAATGLPVVAGPAEATALGNVLVQARASGVGPQTLAGLRTVVRDSTDLQLAGPPP
ncbi:rhamnulokinase [Promicromonospora umidemergens]|uniref:Rhamnulokinase family protein n=1 Tax=Promicromonospora umidemergens TaxID=629679 RepID=A0ABP8X1B3_9MICO|nr:rhamnulokinase family protein [Promicromonospora umidemergens]MCP2285124.1 rhamnulokinase [Promicromonospora umidemergens]